MVVADINTSTHARLRGSDVRDTSARLAARSSIAAQTNRSQIEQWDAKNERCQAPTARIICQQTFHLSHVVQQYRQPMLRVYQMAKFQIMKIANIFLTTPYI